MAGQNRRLTKRDAGGSYQLKLERGFIARYPFGPLVERWFAFCWVGKEQPAYGDNGGDGGVPNRTARERAADDGDDHAGEDTCQQPSEPLDVVG